MRAVARTRASILLAPLILLGAGPEGSSAQAPPVTAGPADAAEQSGPTVKGADLDLLREVRELAERIGKLRGHAFERPPVAVRASREARRFAAESRAAAVLPADRLAARGRAWADVGLGGSGTPWSLLLRLASDLEGIALDTSESRLLVDPERLTTGDFFSTGEGTEPSALLRATGVRPDEPLVAHLLVHHGQLGQGGSDYLSGTTDSLLASAAWREGEANLTAIRYLFGAMGIADQILQTSLDPGEVLGGDLMPGGVEELSETEARLIDFVYREGFDRAVEAFRSEGWRSLERAMRSRTTTRDVLHPDYDPLGQPVLPEHGLTIPDGYRLVDRDSLGEQAVIVLVSVLSGKDNLGLMAGDGWTGDALYRWEPEGDVPAPAGFTLWVSRWSSEEAAADFDYGYARTLASRYPGRELRPVGEGHRLLELDDRVLRIERVSKEVRIRIAPFELDRLLSVPRPR